MKNFKLQILEKKTTNWTPNWTTNWTTTPFFENSKDFKTKKPLIIKGFKCSGYES